MPRRASECSMPTLNGAEVAAARKDKRGLCLRNLLGHNAPLKLWDRSACRDPAIQIDSYGATAMWPFMLGWKRQK